MKKRIVTVAALLSLSLSGMGAAQAAENDWFIGGSLQNQQTRSDQMGENAMRSKQDTDWGFDIKAGRYFGNHRVGAMISHVDGDSRYDDYSQQNYLATYDYMFDLTADSKLRAFAGVSAGLSHTKFDNVGSSNDFVYGAQLGLNYRFMPQWEAEIGYRYLEQDFSEKDKQGDKVEVDHSQQAYIGVNYRF